MKNKETSSRENRSHFEVLQFKFMLIIMVAYMYAPVLNLTLWTFNIQESFDATI